MDEPLETRRVPLMHIMMDDGIGMWVYEEKKVPPGSPGESLSPSAIAISSENFSKLCRRSLEKYLEKKTVRKRRRLLRRRRAAG